MKALITGVTGQDGSFLSKYLAEKGYEVYGLERRKALETNAGKRTIVGKVMPCDITNYASVVNAFQKIQPDEVYHLAAQSYVADSFKDPHQTLDTNIMGTLNMLEAIRNLKPDTKFYFAGSSEQFGDVLETPQTENTPFNPRSPYGVSKCAGFQLTKNYREAYNMFACSGILFNHESEVRGEEFVTRKITRGIADIVNGKIKKISLGNLDAKRDWGYAGDYVKAMHLMLQQDKPDDYVVATGEVHTIREFLDVAFKEVGIADWTPYVEVTPDNFRPSDVNFLQGDASKAKRVLGWIPETRFEGLVKKMIQHDVGKK